MEKEKDGERKLPNPINVLSHQMRFFCISTIQKSYMSASSSFSSSHTLFFFSDEAWLFTVCLFGVSPAFLVLNCSASPVGPASLGSNGVFACLGYQVSRFSIRFGVWSCYDSVFPKEIVTWQQFYQATRFIAICHWVLYLLLTKYYKLGFLFTTLYLVMQPKDFAS